jgi:hypothetical protein
MPRALVGSGVGSYFFFFRLRPFNYPLVLPYGAQKNKTKQVTEPFVDNVAATIAIAIVVLFQK